MTTDLNQQTFADFIGTGLVLIDFWAPWCGPCRVQGPILDKVAEAVPTLIIGKVNVDENHELATQYNVSTIPYLVIFKNGEKVTDFVGMRQADVLVEAINKLP